MQKFVKSPNKMMSQSSVSINEKALSKQQQKILEILNTQNFSKPTNVEAQRILKILEDLLLNTEILTHIDTYFISEFYDLSQSKLSQADINSLSPELLSLLQKQAKYEYDFKELEKQEEQSLKDEELYKKQLEQRSEGDEDEETNEEERNRLRIEKINRQRKRKQEQIQIKHLLENNLRNILRHLRINPDDFAIIKNMKTQSNDMQKLKICIRCINYIMMKKLSTAAEEKDSHEKQLKELEERIKALESTTKKQEEELNKTKKERKKFTDEKQEEIQKYKDSIKSIKDKKQRDLENIKNTTEQNIKALTADHEQKKENLKKELEKVEKELNEIKLKNKAMEDKTLTSKKNYENQLSEAIKMYDQDMEKYTIQLNELQKEYNAILKRKNDFQEYFDKLKKDEEREKKISEMWEKKEKDHNDQQKMKAEAATHLQTMVKEYLLRKKKKKGKKRGMGKK